MGRMKSGTRNSLLGRLSVGAVLLLSFIVTAVSAAAAEGGLHSSSELYRRIRGLKVLGSVLYVAAHPDDENTTFIAYCAKQKQLRTGYFSFTRGSGGQNLIGSEQGPLLGAIRTEELLQARSIDGGQQFFFICDGFRLLENFG